MSLAADAREAVRSRPFIHAGLRAGVLNYTAAATWLVEDPGIDLSDEPEAVATALRRFESDLTNHDHTSASASVSMRNGVSIVSETDDPDPSHDGPTLAVGGTCLQRGGSSTAIVADGDLDPNVLAYVLRRIEIAGIDIDAAGVAEGTCLFVVGRRDGARALRTIEDALETIPSVATES
ncbi:hypothetical protein ACERIT_08600 [Halopenitus sp. H-Gu1]|uniref:DUF7523 family protein n=1 Tax=Halopenitus sp. H-Gu1 TaxID=3242697 RepID=UPI00359D54EC